MKKLNVCLLVFVLTGLLSMPGWAKSIDIGDEIEFEIGANIRLAPTSEVNHDFGVSDSLTGTQEKNLASNASMTQLGVFGDSTRTHMTEAGGAVKDGYIRTENDLNFTFSRKDAWKVFMQLEMDTVMESESADRTDFTTGHDTQQFGIERFGASFNLPSINSRLKGGWTIGGSVDIGYGGLVYGDDDPGFGLVGSKGPWNWEAWYIKKTEKQAGYMEGNNPMGTASQGKSVDRNLYIGKLGRSFGPTHLEGFYLIHHNLGDKVGNDKIKQHFAGLQGKGTYGIVKPTFELTQSFGDYEKQDSQDADISSFAGYADVAFDLSKTTPLEKLEPHIGGFYLQGDDDPNDNDLEGFTPATGITRFTPRFGSDVAGISYDGNPVFGQILYSFFPTLYGSGNYIGGGIAETSQFDNPGFQMIGGGLDTACKKWTYKTNIMAMWFNEAKAVENYWNNYVNGDVNIDNMMGVEWNNEVNYQLYKEVTLKGAASFLFPGDGAKDITRAMNAQATNSNFSDAQASDDVSMLFRANLVWSF